MKYKQPHQGFELGSTCLFPVTITIIPWELIRMCVIMCVYICAYMCKCVYVCVCICVYICCSKLLNSLNIFLCKVIERFPCLAESFQYNPESCILYVKIIFFLWESHVMLSDILTFKFRKYLVYQKFHSPRYLTQSIWAVEYADCLFAVGMTPHQRVLWICI